VVNKKYLERWYEINERHDTVTKPDPVLQAKIKDSLRKRELREFNFTQGRWGFVYIKEQFLAEQTEITIGEWLNYIYYSDLKHPIIESRKTISDSSKKKLLNIIPDSNLYPIIDFFDAESRINIFTKCKSCDLLRIRSLDGFAFIPFEKQLLDNKKKRDSLLNYLKYPITGISYEQAINFCKWRTSLDSIRWLPEKDANGNVIVDWDYSYVYTLPTEAEFNKFNIGEDSISTEGYSLFNYKNAVFNKKNTSTSILNFGKKPAPAYYEQQSRSQRNEPLKHVYNIRGNVAEMTSEKGKAKGGSYNHFARECNIEKVQEYTKPELWLGFRCVAKQREY
jgi:formylglycine-generating enzyme required for sulfatase activity